MLKASGSNSLATAVLLTLIVMVAHSAYAQDLKVLARDQDDMGVMSQITFIDSRFQKQSWGETSPLGDLSRRHKCSPGETVVALAAKEQRKYAQGDSICRNPLTPVRLFRYETLRRQLRGSLVVFVPEEFAKIDARLLQGLIVAIRGLGFFGSVRLEPLSWARYYREAQVAGERHVLFFASRATLVRAIEQRQSGVLRSLTPYLGPRFRFSGCPPLKSWSLPVSDSALLRVSGESRPSQLRGP